MDRRDAFLIEMYKQLHGEISRHIMVIWQSLGVIVGSFTISSLVEKKVLSGDMACTIIVLLCGWLYCHLLDCAYWYNRNLAMIGNIERQFLLRSDLREVQYYFGKHRPTNRMFKHLKIQATLAVALGVVVLGHHAWRYFLLPLYFFGWSGSYLNHVTPYVAAIACIIIACVVKRDRDEAYAEFITNSPGQDIDTEGIRYGVGHGHDRIVDKGES